MHATGCTFDSLGGRLPPISVADATASTSFAACTFQNCGGVSRAAGPGRRRGRELAEAEAEERHVIAVRGGASVRLERCEFRRNPVKNPVSSAGSGTEVYTDDAALEVKRSGGLKPARSLDAAPAGGLFLTADDAWLADTQQVRDTMHGQSALGIPWDTLTISTL